MKRRVLYFKLILTLSIYLFIVSCCIPSSLPQSPRPLPKIRFLLTFDDGPSSAITDNSTAKIIKTLAVNNVQSDIKAIFFVQSRWNEAGGSVVGEALMQRLVKEGHLLGLHSGSEQGHISHLDMTTDELTQSLIQGSEAIQKLNQQTISLLRPPYWEMNNRTLSIYQRLGFSIVLTDVSAYDGGAVIFQVSPEDSDRFFCNLLCVRQQLRQGHIRTIKGVAPIIVTFHDTNSYTAEHLESYLTSLIQAAQQAGFEIATPAFYNESIELFNAAKARTQPLLIWKNTLIKNCAG